MVCLKKDNSKPPPPPLGTTHPSPFLPKENKGPHMKIRPPAYGPHKEKKSPPHGEKGPHDVKKNPLGKEFPERGERLLFVPHPPPPLSAHVWHCCITITMQGKYHHLPLLLTPITKL